MTPLLLVGGGGHCKAAIDVIETQKLFSISGIIERKDTKVTSILGYDIVGNDDDLPDLLSDGICAIVTIGQIKSPAPRKKSYNYLEKLGAQMATITSPRAHVSRHTVIGTGTLIMHDVIINSDAKIGDNCILNTKALIEHDVLVGHHCHISTGVRVNGNVTIKDGCFIGSGAILKNGITIGRNSVVGAGCVILRDLPDNSIIQRT